MKIIFHCYQLSVRGTEVAIYDYADYNEKFLGNESIIITPQKANHSESAINKFKQRFKSVLFYSSGELESLVSKLDSDIFYVQKSGELDSIMVQNIKNCVHVVFRNFQPHGDVYAYISEWLAKDSGGEKSKFVPYMVSLPSINSNLRDKLNIPYEAIVIGRHGGADSFDIKFVKEVILDIVDKRSDIYFLFLGTNEFGGNWFKKRNPRIIFLPPTSDLEYKTMFINTCDAMLHARYRGETFGLAVAEFSIRNKPVMTYSLSEEKAHIFELGDKGLYYSNSRELESLLLNFKTTDKNWDCYSEKFSPENVMKKFKEVFLS